jgi:hypothetical protein
MKLEAPGPKDRINAGGDLHGSTTEIGTSEVHNHSGHVAEVFPQAPATVPRLLALAAAYERERRDRPALKVVSGWLACLTLEGKQAAETERLVPIRIRALQRALESGDEASIKARKSELFAGGYQERDPRARAVAEALLDAHARLDLRSTLHDAIWFLNGTRAQDFRDFVVEKTFRLLERVDVHKRANDADVRLLGMAAAAAMTICATAMPSSAHETRAHAAWQSYVDALVAQPTRDAFEAAIAATCNAALCKAGDTRLSDTAIAAWEKAVLAQSQREPSAAFREVVRVAGHQYADFGEPAVRFAHRASALRDRLMGLPGQRRAE